MVARRFRTVHACVGGSATTRSTIDAALGAAGVEVVHVDEAGLVARLEEVVVLACGVAPRIDWAPARRMRLLQFFGSGIDTLWPAAGLPKEVEIANARGIHLPEMRDHALALMLAFERGLPKLLAAQRDRRWTPTPAGTLHGKIAVILGLGEVGRSIALAGVALGMRTIGVRANPRPTPSVDEVHAPTEIDRLLPIADYVIVAVPLTDATRGLLCAERLARLRADAVLIALSRGGIVDEEALDAKLRAGTLRGAALDVFAREPLPETSPLWTAPNLIVTPHSAGWVGDYIERALSVLIENLDLLERDLPPRTRVQRDRQY